MDDLDGRFFRSILVGAVIGVPTLWVILTAIALLATDQSFLVAAGSAGVAAVFCGPFIGGLFTTSRIWKDPEAVDAEVPAVDEPEDTSLAA